MGQLGRYKQDIKAEEELLSIFRRKGEKQSSIIDKDQETLQKDEQNLQILFYQRGEIQKEIDNPYYKGDKDTDGNADSTEGSGDDDAAVTGSNSTGVVGSNSTAAGEVDGEGIDTGAGNSTTPEGAPEAGGAPGPDGAGGGNNSTMPTPVVGGGNSTNATSIPAPESDTEPNCKPTIYNAYCSKTFKKVKDKVKGDDGGNAKASGGLRGAWNAIEKGVGVAPAAVKSAAPMKAVPAAAAPVHPVVHPAAPVTAAAAPVHPASVIPATPAAPIHPAVPAMHPLTPA